VIIMDDVGETSATLKELVLNNALTADMGTQIGRELAKFLARIHGHNSSTRRLCTSLETNEQARKMSGWVTYGRLVATLSGQSKLPLLPEPPTLASTDLEMVGQIAENVIKRMEEANATVTHGDFWPGNVLINLSASEGGERVIETISVVDWELAKPGLPGLDIGEFLLRHMTAVLLKSPFRPVLC
jgi:aminoglycoside phosphotransferase (APT) family kinase protein